MCMEAQEIIVVIGFGFPFEIRECRQLIIFPGMYSSKCCKLLVMCNRVTDYALVNRIISSQYRLVHVLIKAKPNCHNMVIKTNDKYTFV